MDCFNIEAMREKLLGSTASSRLRTQGTEGGHEYERGVYGEASADHGDVLKRQDEVALTSGEDRRADGNGTSPADDDCDDGAGAGALPPSSSVTGVQIVACLLLWSGLYSSCTEPAIRKQLLGLMRVNFSSGCRGVVGGAVLIAVDLALGAVMKQAQLHTTDAGERVRKRILRAYGRTRRVAAVTAVSLCCGLFAHAYVETVFRGMLPLVVAAKTGMPTVAVVGLSSGTYGVIAWLLASCVSRWMLVSCTLVGVYMHALVLLTGSMFVPIVAHSIFEAFCATVAHVKATRPPRGVEMAPREQ